MILKAITHRRSVRSFLKKQIPTHFVKEVIATAQFAPSSHNNRSLEFVIVTDPQMKSKLHQLLGQDFILQAPVLIIPVIDTEKSEYPIQDLSVASQNLFLQATHLKLGTVWKNISENLVEKIKTLLKLPSNFTLINLIPLGYPKNLKRPYRIKDFNPKKIHYHHW